MLPLYPYKNKDHWTGVLRAAAYVATYDEMIYHLNSILQAMPLSTTFIENSDPRNWANALFAGKKWGVMNTNLVESWNSWVVKARGMAPCAMLDQI